MSFWRVFGVEFPVNPNPQSGCGTGRCEHVGQGEEHPGPTGRHQVLQKNIYEKNDLKVKFV